MKICFCATSILWIEKHLMKKHRKAFIRLITRTNPKAGLMDVLPLKGKKRRSSKPNRATKKKRKFSPAQLRAQRLFAKRSRAGTLRRR